MELSVLQGLADQVSEYMLTVMENVVPFQHAYSPVEGELIRVDPRFLVPSHAEFMTAQRFPEVCGILQSSQCVDKMSMYPHVRRTFLVQVKDNYTDLVLHLPLLKEWMHPSEYPEQGGIVRFHKEEILYRVITLEELGEDEVKMTLARWNDYVGMFLPVETHTKLSSFHAWISRYITKDFARVNDIREEAMKAYRVYREKGGKDQSAEVFGVHHMNSYGRNYSLFRILRLTVEPQTLLSFIEYVQRHFPTNEGGSHE